MILSILIAAYNVEAFIEKCIYSCFCEELAHIYEIILVNDGSTDKTLEICIALNQEIGNLKIINKVNEGLGAARNTGIQEASGDYIWMIDGDDFLEPNSISNVVKLLNSKVCDVYAFNYNIVKQNGELINVKYLINHNNEVLSGSHYYNKYFYNSYTWQYIFKKKLFDLYKFKERINMQDSEIFPKIMYHSQTVAYLDFVAYNYVQQENSFTNTNDKNKRIKYFESIIVVKKSLELFAKKIKNKDRIIYNGVVKKIASLNEVVFNHLVYYKYSDQTLKTIIFLLKNNNLYPLKFIPKGKLKLVKFGLNIAPLFTKRIIDRLR
jgi:glycosyltransferase involved in cell wall biosynthesis